jgi:hypothetical protein
MAPDIDAEAYEPEGSELPQSAGGAVAAAQLVSYLVTAYRWGCTNEHAYHVYCGADRTKALALARAENADRGGKYAAVVWEFDADGTEQRAIAYFHSSLCPENAVIPHHNHKIDYFERIGQFVDEAMSGKALLPDPANEKYLTYQEVAPLPDFLRAQVERQRQFLTIWQGFDTKHAAELKGSSSN